MQKVMEKKQIKNNSGHATEITHDEIFLDTEEKKAIEEKEKTTFQALIEDALFSYVALDDTKDYVMGYLDYYRTILKNILKEKGQKTSETIVRGWKIGLRDRKVMVCDCHKAVPYACPNIEEGLPVVVIWVVDGETLYIERPKAHNDFPHLSFGGAADAERDNLLAKCLPEIDQNNN